MKEANPLHEGGVIPPVVRLQTPISRNQIIREDTKPCECKMQSPKHRKSE
jgi:hypothetical protein